MTGCRVLLLLALGHIALPNSASAQRPTPLDVVLVGGRVLDPETNLDAVRAVGISGGRIVSVTTAVPAAHDTVDVRGLVVAPGFIELHSHVHDSISYRYLARDGVTTALELELGTYPVAPWYAKREGKSLINFGVSASHPGARRAMLDGDSTAEGIDVIGATGAFVRSPIERARLPQLERRLDAALDEGALGIGMGINYTPAATREEILRGFGVAARRHAPVFVHLRSAGLLDGAGGVAGIQEVIADAAATGASLHVVHVTSMGLGATPVLLDLIEGARARGLDVTTEAYPYTAGATMLQSAIFDPGFQERQGIDYKDLLWVATGERLTAESFERYRKQGGLVVVFSIPESAADQAYRVPHVMVASDGLFRIQAGVPIGHPRTAGTHARILGRFVRERGVISLMDGVRKMTLLPARRLEGVDPDMKRKGRVQPGADADLVVFDPARVIDRATFEQPAQYSDGIIHVLVNGTFVVRGSDLVAGVAPGRPVRAQTVVKESDGVVAPVVDDTARILAFFKDTALVRVLSSNARSFDLRVRGKRDSLRAVLRRERALWRAKDLRDYRFLLRVECFCPGQRGWLLIEVRNRQPLRAWDKTGKAVALTGWNTFSIDGMFDNLQRSLDRYGNVRIAFDRRWHFPAYLSTVTLPGPDSWGIIEARGLRSGGFPHP